MYRFIAMVWDEYDEATSARAHSLAHRLQVAPTPWNLALDDAGTRVWHNGGCPGINEAYTLEAGRGVILGHLFRRHPDDQHVIADVTVKTPLQDASRITESRGRRLIDGYWGRYVGFLRGPKGERLVLRDPSGCIPCYFAQERGVTILFSHLEDAAWLNTEPMQINWSHICGYLHFSRLVSSETGIRQVKQVHAGECVEIRPNHVNRTFYWHPADICRSTTIENHEEAATALRKAVLISVSSWAQCYRSILHELSGGLDSSIVLACLTRATNRRDIVCFNMYTEHPEGDERIAARSVARYCGSELIESPFRCDGKSLQGMLNTVAQPSPVMATMTTESEELRAQIVRSRSVQAIFSGQGGDNFFQRRRDSLIAAEYAHRHGLKPGIARVIMDTAHLTGKPVWSILADSVRYGILRRPFDPYAVCRNPVFLHRNALDLIDSSSIRHPWLRATHALPGIKLQQIFDVIDSQIFYSARCGYADVVHPLISQPVIECALRIPSYVLTEGGRERSLARRAFAGELPREILDRSTKGAATAYFYGLIARNLPFIRELLLEGALVSERLIDRSVLEPMLSPAQLLRGGRLGPVLSAILAENWVTNLTRLRRP